MAVLSDAQREAGWTIAKLGDITTKIGSGSTPRGGKSSYVDEGPMVIRSQNVLDNELDLSDVAHVPEELTAKLKSVLVQKGDTLLNITGSGNTTIGRSALVNEDLGEAYVNQHVCIIRPNKSLVNEIFLQKSIFAFKDELLGLSYGSTRDALTKGIIESFEIPLPPLEEQERIAGILGSLDDKIEANTRLIHTLLDTADSVFQKFYSECELSESTYASLEVYGGGTPSTKNETYWGGDIQWLTPTDVTSLGSPILFDTARKLTEDGLNACSSKLHPAGSIMMTSRATIGAFAINQYPAATNQGFIVAVPQREEERWWIYHHMKKDVPEMINSANGTTFLEISRRTFKGLPYGSLSDENLGRFHAVVNPLYERVKSSEQENLQLAETRDALIKRLIG